ncbi:class I SAM-dependent methyltransferase [Pseudomonas cremoricolorata]|uniref:class I SAM-dependent methyltransferase n=1 Tax=Pseudomonas cremoricolorata TaxID=157783 RepID=UPI000535385A|nr:class I SAM-dependent methyltransferase [Pseudomonas cremoricolorata]
MPCTDDVIAHNREAWNASAPHHRDTPAWQWLCEAVRNERFNCLDETLNALLSQLDLSGKRVIQLGCNNGREVLSLFALGAHEVVGVDQSAAFLEHAQALTALSPHAPTFIEADIHHLPAPLTQHFDVALITIGVLNWMPDLGAFLRHVASTLVPGGHLVIYETHPFLEVFEPSAADPWQVARSYFQREPLIEDGAIVYEGQGQAIGLPSYWHLYTLGELFNGLVAAGLHVRGFEEYAHSNREDLYDLYEQGGERQVPMCYTLVAQKA